MKTIKTYVMGIGFIISIASASAQVILNLDMQTNSNTQSGFTEFKTSEGPSVSLAFTRPSYADADTWANWAPSGNITVTLTSVNGGNVLFRDRGALSTGGAFTYENLYRDIAVAQKDVMTVDIAGLKQNTSYQLVFYSYDHNTSPVRQSFYNITGGANTLLGEISWMEQQTFTSNDQLALSVNATTNSLGELKFSISEANQKTVALNGLQIIAIIPEPSTWVLLSAGVALLAVLRRRR